MRYYAVLYERNCNEETENDRLYRFESNDERMRFIGRTFSDPARPKSLPIKLRDASCRFKAKSRTWLSDELGEYVTTKKA